VDGDAPEISTRTSTLSPAHDALDEVRTQRSESSALAVRTAVVAVADHPARTEASMRDASNRPKVATNASSRPSTGASGPGAATMLTSAFRSN
jgi:hypothetical protein